MRNALLFGVIAIAIGMAAAAAILFGLKPQDRPIAFPGSIAALTSDKPSAPPLILPIGQGQHRIDVVLGDDHDANREAFRLASLAAADNEGLALNVVPAMSEESPSYEAFSWALAAGDARPAFVEGLMGTTGAISPQVLAVLAQNNGLDGTALEKQSKSDVVRQSMDQAHSILPPGLPALYVNGQWLTGDLLNAGSLNEALGRSTAASDENGLPGHVVVSEAYAYATSPTPKVAAVFMVIENKGGQPVTFTGAVSPVAGRLEFHSMEMSAEGVMKMRKLDSVTLDPKDGLVMDPHGHHVMMFDLPAPLVVGQRFPLALQTADGTEISTFVTVTRPGEALTAGPQSE